MKKILLTILLLAAQAAAARAAADPEREELLAIFTENRPVYDACYTLAVAKVLTGEMRDTIMAASTDKRKGTACALAITSSEAGIRVTDGASLDRLHAYFTKMKWCAMAEVDVKNARNAIEMFYLDNARYPATLAEATATSPMEFKSVMEYRQGDNRQTYHLTATSDGCDKIVDFDSETSVFSTRPKAPAPGQ